MKIFTIRKRQKGFTLIELLVVIVILGILAGIAALSVPGFLEQGRRTKALADAAALASSINILNTTITPPYTVPLPPGITDLATDIQDKLVDNNLMPQLSKPIKRILYSKDSNYQTFNNDGNVYFDGPEKNPLPTKLWVVLQPDKDKGIDIDFAGY